MRLNRLFQLLALIFLIASGIGREAAPADRTIRPANASGQIEFGVRLVPGACWIRSALYVEAYGKPRDISQESSGPSSPRSSLSLISLELHLDDIVRFATQVPWRSVLSLVQTVRLEEETS